MADDKADVGGPEIVANSAKPEFDPGRRKALVVGSLLVPSIITLHATPAWAQTDYTTAAYRYGDHAGLCKNPEFKAGNNDDEGTDDPHAPEFVECDRARQPKAGSDFDF